MKLKIKNGHSEIKLRNTALDVPKELSNVVRQTANAKAVREKETKDDAFGKGESKAVNDATNKLKTQIQGSANYTLHKVYDGGKKLAEAKQANYSSKNSPPRTSYKREDQNSIKNARNSLKTKKEKGAKGYTPRTAKKTISIKYDPVKAKKIAAQKAQERISKQMKNQAMKKAMKQAIRTFRTIKRIIAHSVRTFAKAAITVLGSLGGLIALVVILYIGIVAVLATPFGIIWSGEETDPNAPTVSKTVAEINNVFNAEVSRIEHSAEVDSVILQSSTGSEGLFIRNWTDVVAVFACKSVGADENAMNIITMDEERKALLSEVFWEMNTLSHHTEEVAHSTADEDGNVSTWTETVLYITLTSKTALDTAEEYGFSNYQNEALEELLKPEYAQMLAELVGTLGDGTQITLTPEQIREMLDRVPKDLSDDRKEILEAAYSLVGKVNYFWGGKSSSIGWDLSWGTYMRVTAPGSRTSGTMRPYGLDCSGFVDWAFLNGIGQTANREGGGTYDQKKHSTVLSWGEALPGDIVFYPDISHIGIFVGVDEGGNPLIAHCASGQNNVVLTGLQGFTIVARPSVL